jgi:hypothetical protein
VKGNGQPPSTLGGERNWLVSPDGYSLIIPDFGIYLDLTRIRRDKQETIALLRVRVKFRGARTILSDGLLSSADFNCSSLRARKERAKHLEERARTTEDIDWFGILEELCVRVLEAEEVGEEERPLENVPMNAEHDSELDAGGLPLLRKHPTIWFGDGGSAKSYLALWAAVTLAQAGERVLYCDWEFSGEDHRRRLHRLVGPIPNMPQLLYRRCDRPLNRDIGRIKSILLRNNTTFLICDSLGFAADGTPESAEAATNYYKALRELPPIGSLHLAHISKAEEGDKKPFGSVFWANGARATWFMKRTDADLYSDGMTVGFYHRKSNVGRLRADFGMKLDFVGTETRVFPAEIAQHPELAAKMPLKQRMAGLLKIEGPMSLEALAEAIPDSKSDSIRRIADREEIFRRASDGKIALVSSKF